MTAPATLYVEARQCTACTHVGLNDSSDTLSVCTSCTWSGDTPAEDCCPGCGTIGTMAAACPKCGESYVLMAESELPLAATAPNAGAPLADVRRPVADQGNFPWPMLNAPRTGTGYSALISGPYGLCIQQFLWSDTAEDVRLLREMRCFESHTHACWALEDIRAGKRTLPAAAPAQQAGSSSASGSLQPTKS